MPYIDKSCILFVINPNSGGIQSNVIINRIRNFDQKLAFIVTKNIDELKIILNDLIIKYTVFVAVGGDGTVHELIKYLVNREDKFLAIWPNGSGNGLALELKFSKDLILLMKDIVRGETLSLDLLDINGHKCINIGGLGFDSYVAHKFKYSKRGLQSYVRLIIEAAFKFKDFKAHLFTSQEELTGNYRMITIANSRQFGNSAVISPDSKLHDGSFEIVLIKPFPAYYYLTIFFKMYFTKIRESKYIKYLKNLEYVSILSEYHNFHLDGEPYLSNGSLEIRINKGCIKVIKTMKNKL